VRGETDGRETLYLEYEAYPEMAEKLLQQVADEVRLRWREIRQVAIVHRTGRLEIGETAVVIALSAAHRGQVFEALQYAIDRVKEIVPIWKKEFWADGAEWKSEQ
jgi:molybdopterin synthase catalytic subunit